METKAQTNIGSWIYCDDYHELDFEVIYGKDINFYIFCSVENLKFIGDQIPQKENYGMFDYIRYKFKKQEKYI